MRFWVKALLGLLLVGIATELAELPLGLPAFAVEVWALGQPESASSGYLQRCRKLGQFIFSQPEGERWWWQVWAARFGGFRLTALAMRSRMDDPETLQACSFLFCAMAMFNRRASLMAGETDAIPTLLEAMRRWPDHAGLQAQASSSMGAWCDWTPETELKVAALGGPQAILAALNNFPTDAHVQFLGWAGLSSVSNQLSSKKIIIGAGAVSAGMHTMRDPVLRKGHRVRQEVIMTFANLAANCEECTREIMGSGDIIEEVKQAMDDEEPDSRRGTLTDGVQLMMELARTNRTNRRAIVEAGFIPYTLRAMQEHPNAHPQSAWPLCEMGLQLLYFLGEEDEAARAEMVAKGATDVVRMSMQAEPLGIERQYRGRTLLSLLGS